MTTLWSFLFAAKKSKLLFFSDNVARNKVTERELNDFVNDTGLDIKIQPNHNTFHDRYIVIDYKRDNKIIYLCGSSSKDSGNSLTTIMEIKHIYFYHQLIDELLQNE